jgi:endogenous inhibitor of DNA gyrase (YacG/DUF329 family)
VNTVKAFCRRNTPSCTIVKCKQCDKEFAVTPHSKPKSFCSDACRYKWWNANRQAQTTHICEHCGREFISYESAQRRFCGRSCYIAHRFSEGGVLGDKGAV